MLDIAVAYNRYKFLGNEFLTWMWFLSENEKNISSILNSDEKISLETGNSIVLENRLSDKSREKIIIKRDRAAAGLEEGKAALKKGALVTEINLILKIGENEYEFTIKGENFNLTGLKTPVTDTEKQEDEIEAVVLEKTFFCLKAFETIDSLFLRYLEQRISDDWKNRGLARIRKWIENNKI